MEGDTHKSRVSRPTTPLDHHDEDQRVARTVGCATAPTKAATRQEAAGAQAVKRGCPVRLEEVLDRNDMSFKIWQKANLNPPVEPEVTQLMVAGSIDPSMKTEKVPSEWLKTVQCQMDAMSSQGGTNRIRSEGNLKNWIHKTRVEEVVNQRIEDLCGLGRTQVLEQLDELQTTKMIHCWLSGSGKDLVTDAQVETLENITWISTLCPSRQQLYQ